MRFGLPLMLAVSVALHAFVAGGIALVHFRASTTPSLTSSEADDSSSITLLRSVETPDFQQRPSAQRTHANPVLTSVPTALPSPDQADATKEMATATPPPSFALEANPNAHVRELPPEVLLSPVHAPHLDGSNGVVFLLDVSGSMYEPYAGTTRLALARQALAQQIRALKNGTPFAITIYAEHARNSGPLVAANDATRDAAIRYIMRDMDCGGGTNLPDGMAVASELQAGSIVLVSDGDLNISRTDLLNQAHAILGDEKHGPSLTILGICPRPNTKDGLLLQSLADQQGGAYRALQADAALLTAATSSSNVATP